MSTPPHRPWSHGAPPPPGPYGRPPAGPPPQPGYPPYPGYPQAPLPPPPKNKRIWVWVAVGAVSALLMATVLIVLARGDRSGSDSTAAGPSTTVSAPPADTAGPDAGPSSSPVSTSAGSPPESGNSTLAGYLQTREQLEERMKGPLTPSTGESGTAPLAVTVTPPECTGNVTPATATIYSGIDYTDMVVQGFRGPGNSVTTNVIEAVVRFPDAAAAKRFLNDQYADMSSCVYKAVTVTYPDGATFDGKTTAVGKNTDTEGDLLNTIVFPNPLPADTGKGCDRALGRHDAVIVDVAVCRDAGSGGYGTGLARAILRAID